MIPENINVFIVSKLKVSENLSKTIFRIVGMIFSLLYHQYNPSPPKPSSAQNTNIASSQNL